MTQDRSDPVIDEVREVRERISARFDHDPARLVAYYMELQRKYQDRLIDPSKTRGRHDESTEFDAAVWDKQFERDVAEGRLDALANEALRDAREG